MEFQGLSPTCAFEMIPQLWNAGIFLDCLLTAYLFPSHMSRHEKMWWNPLELGCGTVPSPRWVRHSLGLLAFGCSSPGHPGRMRWPHACRNVFVSLGGKCWRKTLVLWAVQFISLQNCNGWHLFAFLCGFGKEERIWIQNSYKMAWHGVAWIGLSCLLLLWITFHINFRLWVRVSLASWSCTRLWVVLLFEEEILHVYLLREPGSPMEPRSDGLWAAGVKLTQSQALP